MNKAVESFFFSLLLKIKKMKRITILILLFLAISCCNDDSNTYYFTDAEKELFYYAEGSNFKLLVLPDQDTLSCEVISVNEYHEERTYFMHKCPSYADICEIEIHSDNEIKIDIRFVSSIEGFELKISLDDGITNQRNFSILSEEPIDDNYFSKIIDGKVYDNIVELTDKDAIEPFNGDTLIYSPNFGIIKITNSVTEKKYYLID